jgi:hypothetical protein
VAQVPALTVLGHGPSLRSDPELTKCAFRHHAAEVISYNDLAFALGHRIGAATNSTWPLDLAESSLRM